MPSGHRQSCLLAGALAACGPHGAEICASQLCTLPFRLRLKESRKSAQSYTACIAGTRTTHDAAVAGLHAAAGNDVDRAAIVDLHCARSAPDSAAINNAGGRERYDQIIENTTGLHVDIAAADNTDLLCEAAIVDPPIKSSPHIAQRIVQFETVTAARRCEISY